VFICRVGRYSTLEVMTARFLYAITEGIAIDTDHRAVDVDWDAPVHNEEEQGDEQQQEGDEGGEGEPGSGRGGRRGGRGRGGGGGGGGRGGRGGGTLARLARVLERSLSEDQPAEGEGALHDDDDDAGSDRES
jgi:hypothetical protein